MQQPNARCTSDLALMCFASNSSRMSISLVTAPSVGPTPLASISDVFGVIVLAAALLVVLIFRCHYMGKVKREDGAVNTADICGNFAPGLEQMGASCAAGKCIFSGIPSKTRAVSVEFEELGLSLPDGREILHGVTGKFSSHQMAAIMGPSGAGKTSFLNVLCGRTQQGFVKGQVRINGETTEIAKLQSVVGFVPQEDVVHEHLTAREQIFYSAQLRNPAGTAKSEIDRIVAEVLSIMQLACAQNNVVGSIERPGVSGGQRKRVNIGLELAACPAVLFLDEPTSGLDATSALSILSSLKVLSGLGTTIVMSIHQPRYSVFTLFDSVLLLGVGGRTVFLGPSHSALSYFQDLGYEAPRQENAADWLMDVISGEVRNTDPNFRQDELFSSWLKRRTNGFASLTSISDVCLASPLISEMLTASCTSNSCVAVDVESQISHEWCIEEEDEEEERQTQQDILKRELPGHWKQFRVLLHQNMVRFLRQTEQKVSNLCLIAIAAFVFGVHGRGKVAIQNAQMAIKLNMNMVALAVVIAVSCLPILGGDQAVFCREASSGVKVLSFFASRIIVGFLDVIFLCLAYTMIWYLVAQPEDSFWFYFNIFRLVALTGAGWGVLVSIVVPRSCSTLAVSVLILVMGAVLSDPEVIGELPMLPDTWSQEIMKLSPFTWSVGDAYLEAIDFYGGPEAVPWPAQAIEGGYRELLQNHVFGVKRSAHLALLVMSFLLFLLGYICLQCSSRGKTWSVRSRLRRH